ncbi:concanavalin A-like lectin/glucanase domain-containing protein [Exophiala viscosa]|uniref:xyloglucan-specific endo-beta-1,4-glucanase n=1 Tax=Exophiala viscosa TaxID=2486360 RepID=A0AAN6II27_9EURO|nr:concanavalin A-like lectin/glucanase domain-containing protein [Exophiala viscosa]KAI1627543.1 concanavalin A-like lectin/glucanase domain-containing protein [Exophiala viscosa]
MGLKSLISYGFLILPAAVTIGVLLGLQTYRESQGLSGPFTSNKVETNTYCQLAFGITPATGGQQYTLNPNQWGVTEDTTGSALCMNVTTNANGSYPTNITAPAWSITWQYPQGSDDQPVHAFPNIQIDRSDIFPIEINSVSAVNFAAEWAYGAGETLPTTTDVTALTAAGLNANVAIDMFIDSDPNAATSTVDAKYEVMIWLADFGAATQPIGLADGAVKTADINGTTFSLYYGTNSLSQKVLTWVATGTVQNIDTDFGPLLQGLTGIGGPATSDYLGYMAFGSETLYSSTNVTLYVPSLSMEVVPK